MLKEERWNGSQRYPGKQKHEQQNMDKTPKPIIVQIFHLVKDPSLAVAECSGHQLLPNPSNHLLSSLISYKSKETWKSGESRDISSHPIWKQNMLKNLQHFPRMWLSQQTPLKGFTPWSCCPLWCFLDCLQRTWYCPKFRTDISLIFHVCASFQ